MAYSKARRLAQLLGTDGTVSAGKIPADAIDGTKIADDAINSEHYTDISIDTAHIGDDQVTAAKLANAINTDIATGVTANTTANTANTTANAALPKAGGAMTGAITTNSTFDGVDIATRDALLTSTISDVALKATIASPTLTGTPAAPTASGSTSTTQLATTAFVQQELTTLIGGAPSTLNDLNELAAAINDDANYNSTLTTALATKLPLAGGTMTGDVTFNGTNLYFNGAASSASYNLALENSDTFTSFYGSTSSSIDKGYKFFTGNQGADLAFTINADRSIAIAGTLGVTGDTTLTGNVGIGGAPSSFGSGVSTILLKGTAANSRAGALNFQEQDGTVTTQIYSTDGSDGYGTVISAAQGDMKFSTGSLTGYKMVILSGGNVGIGTTSPSNPLSVSGVITSGNFTSVGVGGTPGDANTAELGPGYLNLARDDTADAKQILFGKNGAVHSYLETTSSGLNIGGGNVGIGTTSIDNNAKLHIEDSAYPIINLDRSSISSDGNHIGFINFQNNGDVYGYMGVWVEDISETDGEIRFATQKGTSLTDKMVITSDGNVGIGVTPDIFSSGYTALQLNGYAYNIAHSGGDHYITNNAYFNSGWKYGQTGTAQKMELASGRVWLATAASGSADAAITWNTGLNVDVSGKVGIGTTTPGSYAADADNLVIYSAAETGMTIASGTSSTGDIYFADGTSAQNRGFLQYHHADDSFRFGTAATERMRILDSGNVSIGGTADDNGVLSVIANKGSAGDLWTQVGPNNNMSLILQNTSTTDNTNAVLYFANDAGVSAAINARFTDHSNDNTELRFSSHDGSYARERMVLKGDGKFCVGTMTPTKTLQVTNATDSNQMLVHLNNDTAGASAAIYFKADSQITGNNNSFTRAKGGIFFSRVSTRGTGHMYLAVDGVNSDTNASPGGAQLKLTSNPNHGGGLVLKNSAHTVVGRDYTNGVLTNGQSVSWNGSGTTFTNNNLNMNGVGGTGGAWIAGISVAAADGNPSGAAIQVGIHGQGFNTFSTLVSNFDGGLSVTIGAQISISNTSGDTVYYRINVIPLGSRETTVYGR